MQVKGYNCSQLHFGVIAGIGSKDKSDFPAFHFQDPVFNDIKLQF